MVAIPLSSSQTFNALEDRVADLEANPGGADEFADLGGDPADNAALDAALDAKQATLVSGTSIKTVNGTSLLGSGNVAASNVTVEGGNYASAAALTSGGDIDDIITHFSTSDLPVIRDTDIDVPSPKVFPANADLKNGGGLFVKSGTGTLEFEGPTEFTHESFSGFAVGGVTWSGATEAERPAEVSTELWNPGNDSLTDRLKRANAAFGTKSVRIRAKAREITAETQFYPNKEIYFEPGVYPGSFVPAIGNYYGFGIHSNTHFHGPRTAIIQEAPTLGGGRIIGPSELSGDGLYDVRSNIVIEGLTFQGDPGVIADGSGSNILMGNCHQSAVRNVFMDSVHYFGIVLGGAGSTGNYAYDSEIDSNVFVNAPNQAIAVLNSKNCRVTNNLIDTTGSGLASGAMIDCEPNAPDDVMDDLLVAGNTISATDPHDVGFTNVLGGIVVQAAGNIDHAKGNRVRGNNILGRNPSDGFDTRLTFGVYLYGCVDAISDDNYVRNAFQGSYRYYLCRNLTHQNNRGFGSTTATGFNADVSVWGVCDSVIRDHTAQEIEEYASVTGIHESEYYMAATSSGTDIALQEGHRLFDFHIGKTVFFNGTVWTIDDYTKATKTLTATASVGTVTVKTFTDADVNTTTNAINKTAHGYQTGAIGNLTNSGGALPTFATSPSTSPSIDGIKHWYVIRVDADNFKLAVTLEDALANNPSDITAAAGGGTHTFTPEMQTRFSNNVYINNWHPGGIRLAPTGTSQIVSTAHDKQIETVNNANVTVPARGGIYNFINLTTGRTATLPDATYCRGLELGFVDGEGTAATNNITLDGFGSQTIGGAATAVIDVDNGSLRVKSDGANWLIISSTLAAAGAEPTPEAYSSILHTGKNLTSSATMADTLLTLDLPIGDYSLKMFGILVNEAGGWKGDFDGGTCVVGNYRVAFKSLKADDAPRSPTVGARSARDQDFGVGGDGGAVYTIEADGEISITTAGTLILRAAQNSSDAATTTMLQGWYVKAMPGVLTS